MQELFINNNKYLLTHVTQDLFTIVKIVQNRSADLSLRYRI